MWVSRETSDAHSLLGECIEAPSLGTPFAVSLPRVYTPTAVSHIRETHANQSSLPESDRDLPTAAKRAVDDVREAAEPELLASGTQRETPPPASVREVGPGSGRRRPSPTGAGDARLTTQRT